MRHGLQCFTAANWHSHKYAILHFVSTFETWQVTHTHPHTHTQTHLNCKLNCHTHTSTGIAHVCLKRHTKQAWHLSVELDELLFTWKVYWSKGRIRTKWPTNKTRDTMQELQTIFLSEFKIHVYITYTAPSSWYVFLTSPLTVVFYRRRETRRM